MSGVNPEAIKSQASFWSRYGPWLVTAAVAGGAAAYSLYKELKADVGERNEAKSKSTRNSALSPTSSSSAVELSLPYRDTSGAMDLNSDELMGKMTLRDIDWDGKRVLVRTDFNVVVENGVIEDTIRIDQAIPTLKYLLNKKGPLGGPRCVVIISHLGRPAGDFDRKKYSLQPIVGYLEECLGRKVEFWPDCVGEDLEQRTKTCEMGTVILCENLRFHIEEVGKGIVDGKEVTAKPEDIIAFREKLSRLGDVFVFEAYGAAHRPHSSVVGISIPERAAGLAMGREMAVYAHLLRPRPKPQEIEVNVPEFSDPDTSASREGAVRFVSKKILRRPDGPYVVVIGSPMKVTDRVSVIKRWVEHADEIIITGGMAFTFKTVMNHGFRLGKTPVDVDAFKDVKEIVQRANELGVKLHLPTDHCIAQGLSPDAAIGVTTDEMGIPDGWIALDVGPRSRARFSQLITRAKTVVWVGTVGCFEWGAFAGGTIALLQDLVEATKRGGFTVIAGGDAGAAARMFTVGGKYACEQVSYVSSGGGSSLVLMEGKLLHGAAHLTDKPTRRQSSLSTSQSDTADQ